MKLIETRDEKRLRRLQRQLAVHKRLIIDELGYVPLSQTDAELLFEVFRTGSNGKSSSMPSIMCGFDAQIPSL